MSLYVILLALLSPRGESPLNDDWAYAQTVQRLLETGELRISDLVDGGRRVPGLLGALFCLPFGFSHTALRASSLTLGLAEVLAFHRLLWSWASGPAAPSSAPL